MLNAFGNTKQNMKSHVIIDERQKQIKNINFILRIAMQIVHCH